MDSEVSKAIQEERRDTFHRLSEAADVARKSGDSHTAQVLAAQADMVKKGLHERNMDEVPDMMGDIVKFHQKFGLEYNGKPRMLENELFSFRSKFMREELDEYDEEQEGLVKAVAESDQRTIAHHLHQQLDALVDEVYVVLGTAYLQFGPSVFNEAWRRVQAANMAKMRCERDEDSKRGSTFDVIKPPGWEAPDHYDLVKDHVHELYRHPGELNHVSSDTQLVR